MSRFVNVAAVHFIEPQRSVLAEARDCCLGQMRQAEARLGGNADLVVFCEGMVARAQNADTAESYARPGLLLTAYTEFSRRNRCVTAASLKLEDGGKLYNALVFIGRDGSIIGDYRKNFLTFRELDKGVSPGNVARVFDTDAGRIGGVICFDLNFTGLREQYIALQPDIIAFSSMLHGGHMQQAWAFECRSFFAAACRDEPTSILDPFGRMLSSANTYTLVAQARVNLDRVIVHVDNNQDRFGDMRRAYGGQVRIDVAADLGCAAVYSESPERSAADLVREFGLVSLTDYLDKYRGENERKRHG